MESSGRACDRREHFNWNVGINKNGHLTVLNSTWHAQRGVHKPYFHYAAFVLE